uniref:Uncharacterized protein n=1 Tax=Branchiostoma floridae TaxID=7739 RepID=C3Y766_BRAFL|eukprot:XP_002607684.1 hypothetical protein BRAFLDRAFT_82870 [Branchiostoma floridae]
MAIGRLAKFGIDMVTPIAQNTPSQVGNNAGRPSQTAGWGPRARCAASPPADPWKSPDSACRIGRPCDRTAVIPQSEHFFTLFGVLPMTKVEEGKEEQRGRRKNRRDSVMQPAPSDLMAGIKALRQVKGRGPGQAFSRFMGLSGWQDGKLSLAPASWQGNTLAE